MQAQGLQGLLGPGPYGHLGGHGETHALAYVRKDSSLT